MKILLKTLTAMLLMIGLMIGGLTAIQMHVDQKDLQTIVNEDVNGIKESFTDFAIEINNEIALALENN